MDSEDLNLWILELYSKAPNLPLSSFKHWALDRLKQLLEFDSAIWVSRSNPNIKIHPVDVYLYNQPYSFMKSYEALYPDVNRDPVVQAVVANIGQTVQVTELMAPEQWFASDIYLNHARHFDIEDVLSTLLQANSTGVMNVISLYSAKKRYRFSSQEKELKQLLMPHLVEAFRQNILSSIRRTSGGMLSCALLDHFGVIYEADEQFVSALTNAGVIQKYQLKLPGCTGQLRAGVYSLGEVGTLRLEDVDGSLYASLTGLSPLSQLTPRQCEVVKALSQGMDDSALAHFFNVSPKTIRNHLTEIYKRSGITNRAALTRHYLGVQQEQGKRKEQRMRSAFDPKKDFRNNQKQGDYDQIQYLDALSEMPQFQARRRRNLNHLQIEREPTLLDVGCGTGYDCWYWANELGRNTRVVGVDHSDVMIHEAKIRYEQKAPNIRFLKSSAEQLPFKGSLFSATHCERLLCHLETPERAIKEMIRVTKPGGRVVITEADYATTVIHSDHVALTERLVQLMCMSIVNHRIGRQLSGAMAANGLKNIQIENENMLIRSFDEFDRASGLTPSLIMAVEKGVITQEEKEAWLADQKEKDSQGQFFCSTSFFTVVGEV